MTPYTKKKQNIVIVIILFLISLTALRLVWMVALQHDVERPLIEEGVLDLRETSIQHEEVLDLDGEWLFYPDDLKSEGFQGNHLLVDVPGKWRDFLTEESAPVAYGTYQLTIFVDPSSQYTYSLGFPSVRNASEIYVNNQLVGQTGQVGANEEGYTAKNLPNTVTFSADQNGKIDIRMQVANHLDPNNAGIVRSVNFGETSLVRDEYMLSYSMQLFVIIAFVLYAVFSIGFFIVNNRDWFFIYTSLLLLGSIITHSLGSNEKLLADWLDLTYDSNIRLSNLASISIVFSLWMILKESYNKLGKSIHAIVITFISLIFISILVLPIETLEQIRNLFNVVLIFALMITIIVLFKEKVSRRNDDFWLMLALLALLNSFIWWGIWITMGIHVTFYPFDLIITIGCFSIMWFNRYFALYNRSKKQTLRLEKVAQEKDDFLAKTSHELRNPLHGIINLTQSTLQRNKEALSQTSIKELNTVLNSSQRLSLLLDDLFDMANLKMFKQKIEFDTFSLHSVVTGVMDMLYYKSTKNNIRLVNEIPYDSALVYADENRVIQILYNLIDNAIKFTDEGEIIVSVKENKENKLLVKVSDTGSGMDEETLDRMFTPYEQGDHNYNRSEGVGLGLSVVRELIELHGEKLYAQSDPNIGTTISFTLQKSDEIVQSDPAIPFDNNKVPTKIEDVRADEFETDKPRILIIDDDLVNLHVMESLLFDENYEITTVQHVEAFLDEFNFNQWDLLILDVMMPHLSGYDLTNMIRKQYDKTDLPILLITARNNPQDIEAGFNVGANDYVTKPIDGKELKARINNLVQIKQLTENQLDTEIKWLQAQIQPHFIFNTLNTINALSLIDVDKMQELIGAFSDFLRSKFNFNEIDQLISVEEELAMVRSYLYIEQVRYGDRLEVEWDIEGIQGFKIPSLTIQPIVENAIKHGLMKQSQGGKIEIKAFKNEEDLTIIIKDNGVGMDQETIHRLENEANQNSVGLANTNNRLKKILGAGLSIQSEVGEVTTIAFNISGDQSINER